MTERLLVDLDPQGRVTVGVQREEELPDVAGEPFVLSWPLDAGDLEELRWYLEDYLRAPYGADGDRGERVAAALKRWGVAVFGSVFGGGAARDAYIAARERGAPLEIVFRSPSPGLLGLPWELMCDPSRPSPIALDLVGVSRSLPAVSLAESFAVEGDVLRVLMVISRPAGSSDVGYRMVARPLLERLEAVRGHVELVVLRPPTLDALARTLATARQEGAPFQVVHFDGHGALKGRRTAGAGRPLSFEDFGEGVLVFEKPEGGADEVTAAKLAQVLKAGRVPVVVLNACQSGAVGKELEAAVATRLLQEGVSSVVAMAYSVYAVAAAEFIAAFYERLFAGERVTEAVGAGRRRLFERDLRPSPKGEMALSDWVIPVHYRRRDIHFPQLVTARSAQQPLEAMLDEIRDRDDGDGAGALDAVGTFVGRDGLFYELEVACRMRRVVVLHGSGGAGKTELAKAFGRWWRDTGGVDDPSSVVVCSFEPGIASFGLDGVLAAIGRQIFGDQFGRVEPAERERVVLQVARERRMLLIWDNFESVHTMPDPNLATPPLSEPERVRLRHFVDAIANGEHSVLLITSRTIESWLGDAVHRLPVGGLTREETIQYADVLVAGAASVVARRARPAFGELLDALDGHPLSMRLVLPHVATTDPERLLDALRGYAELPAGIETGRLASLETCVGYSFQHLNANARRLLVAVSLVHGLANASALALLSSVEGVPDRFAGVDLQDWMRVLDGAAAVGLLTGIGAGMYRIHPALPSYLAALWRSEEPDDYDHQRARTLRALLTTYAVYGRWLYDQLRSGDAGLALSLVDLQRRMIGYLLGTAIEQELWDEAQAIVAPLEKYLDSRGLYEEARGWVDRIRLATETADGDNPDLDTPAGALWLGALGMQAHREANQGRLADAERICLKIDRALNGQAPSRTRSLNLAATYQQLANIAQLREHLDDAERWYRQSLTINEQLGDRPGIASTCHNLGTLLQQQGRLDDAENWYRQSLTIKDELGDRPGRASTCHHLGTLAQERGRLDDAENWYRQSLTIDKDLGNRLGIAAAYHELGKTALLRRRLDDAENWLLKSLTISEELGNRLAMATTYHYLGSLAIGRGRRDDAERWFRRSMAIYEELGHRPGIANACTALGMLAELRGQDSSALEWIVRGVSLFDEFPHPATRSGPDELARLAAKLGIGAAEACWRTVTGAPMPSAVRNHILASPRRHQKAGWE